MHLSSASGHQWSPESLVLEASPLSVHHQLLEYTNATAETSVVDPILLFETDQGQILREQFADSALANGRKQLMLCKLFNSEQRLQEAVNAATRRPAPNVLHEKTHSDPPIRPHKCIICERGFVRKYDLKVHHQMHIREIRDMMESCGLVLV
ncbi:hypothetical protein BC940DRAFT_336155 [Gongronella butleri]|nr:hypothetical protein BC940DRAFT_336155 [Gongronella butleri]